VPSIDPNILDTSAPHGSYPGSIVATVSARIQTFKDIVVARVDVHDPPGF
jgi:hypothetical protein